MQVISMSLGSDFGNEDDADAEASENAVNAGIVVVAYAGSAGTIPYVVGDPSTGEKAISVAAGDSHASYPGEAVPLSRAGGIAAVVSVGVPAANGTPLQVVVLKNTQGGVSL